MIKGKNEFLDDDFRNIICIKLNRIEYKLIYKNNMLDELNQLLSTLKITSAEDLNEGEYMSLEAAEILYHLFKYYVEQTSLFEKLGLQLQCSLLQEKRVFDSGFKISYSLIRKNRTEPKPFFKNAMFGPFLDNSGSYVQRKKREDEDSSIKRSEIKFATPKSIQDVFKYIKTNKDDLAPSPRISETTKMSNENQYLNLHIPEIGSDINLGSKSKAILKFDFKSESFKWNNSEDMKGNQWKNHNVNEKNVRIHLKTSDGDTQNNNLTLKIFKDFVYNSIVSFKDQLSRIKKQIGGVERRLESVKPCEGDRDLNGNIFPSSSEKLQRIEKTNDGTRSSKNLNLFNRILNQEKLIQEILKGRKRVSGIESGSKIPEGEAVNVSNHQSKSLRRPNLPNSRNISRYFGNSEKLSENEELRTVHVPRRPRLLRNQGLSKNDEESRDRAKSVNQTLLRNQGLARNKELLGDQKRWRDLQFNERDSTPRRVEEGLGFSKMVSDLRNWRHRRIDYNAEEPLFYLNNSKEIPRFVEPIRKIKRRDSPNQDFSDNRDVNRSMHEDQKKNILGIK